MEEHCKPCRLGRRRGGKNKNIRRETKGWEGKYIAAVENLGKEVVGGELGKTDLR